MLYADKQALETDLKVCLLAIRERELDFYTQNCRSIGTSAALLAGFAYAGLSATSDFSDNTTEFSKGLFLTVTTSAMSLNVASMAAATWCSMLGPGLALRGPDGSMDRAVEGLALEYRIIFLLFASGLFAFFLSALLLIVDEFEVVLSAVIALLLLGYLRANWRACKRIYKKFRLPVGQAIAGNFNPDGSRGTAISGCSKEEAELQVLRSNRQWWQSPRRQYLYMKLFYDEFLGVSESVFQQRYERTTFGRAYTYSIHNVIRFLERPDRTPYATDIASTSRTRQRRPSFDDRPRQVSPQLTPQSTPLCDNTAPSSREASPQPEARHRTNRVEPVASCHSAEPVASCHSAEPVASCHSAGSSRGALAAALDAQRRSSPRGRRRGVLGFARRLVAGEQGATLRDACGTSEGTPLPGGLLEGVHTSGVISPSDSLDLSYHDDHAQL